VSDDDDRTKRPQPERTDPIRSWSALFGASASPGRGADEEGTARRRDPPSLNDVVSRSVDLGYRVVDEYIRQGQRAAQRFSDRSYGPDAVVTEVREVADRVTQYSSDMLSLWLEFLELAGTGTAWRPFGSAANGGATSSAAPAAPFADADPTHAAESVHPSRGDPSMRGQPSERAQRSGRERVSVAVTSPYPTEVALDLRSEPVTGPVAVHSLRATDAEKPRISDVRVEADPDGSVRIRVHVPDDHPAGTYSGLIVEEDSNRPVGTLTVCVDRG
jgi:hypothetical protein